MADRRVNSVPFRFPLRFALPFSLLRRPLPRLPLRTLASLLLGAAALTALPAHAGKKDDTLRMAYDLSLIHI